VVAFGTTTLVASILVLLVFSSCRRAEKGV
jgi:hypothetical protein